MHMIDYIHIRLKPDDIADLEALKPIVIKATGNKNPARTDILRFIINEAKKQELRAIENE